MRPPRTGTFLEELSGTEQTKSCDNITMSAQPSVIAMSTRPDPSLLPIERPRCPRCQFRMALISLEQRSDHSEKRTFECPKCSHVDTKVLPDPLRADVVVRLANSLRPPS